MTQLLEKLPKKADVIIVDAQILEFKVGVVPNHMPHSKEYYFDKYVEPNKEEPSETPHPMKII